MYCEYRLSDTDPGWSPTLFEGVCNFNVQSGLLSDQHGTTSFKWLSNHGVSRVKCLTEEHNTNSLAPVGFELLILWLPVRASNHCATRNRNETGIVVLKSHQSKIFSFQFSTIVVLDINICVDMLKVARHSISFFQGITSFCKGILLAKYTLILIIKIREMYLPLGFMHIIETNQHAPFESHMLATVPISLK